MPRELHVFKYAWAMVTGHLHHAIYPSLTLLVVLLSAIPCVPSVGRTDFALLLCGLLQYPCVKRWAQDKAEMKASAAFVLMGLTLEFFKVHQGSWHYAADGWASIFGVPVYVCFLYSSLGSYVFHAYKKLSMEYLPRFWLLGLLGMAMYLNFFTLHYFVDLRVPMMLAAAITFRNSSIKFEHAQSVYRVPLLASLFLTSGLLYSAENVATFSGAWLYPKQTDAWSLVAVGKFGSWFLFVLAGVIALLGLRCIPTRPSPIPDQCATLFNARSRSLRLLLFPGRAGIRSRFPVSEQPKS